MRRISTLFAVLLFILLFIPNLNAQNVQHTFALGDSTFLLDNKPFVIISGEMHYPRIPRECWRARMKAAKAMGLNTIGTYVFWNLHEPQKGKYDFTGNNDVAAFVKTAQEEGLWVILRPSPYVCAEWEFGGYPYWLLKEKGMVVRSTNPGYLSAYRNYIMEIGRQLAPLQVNHGGNILMVQVENEYGLYGSDKEYLDINRKMFIEAGFDGLLYTCDPLSSTPNGHIDGLLPAINGSDNIAEIKKVVNENHNGKGPYFISEWYPAWFDWWGEKHHEVDPADYAAHLDSILAAGISINMYMFHGGTTRGFMNGANYNDYSAFAPQISSYDYDAPLNEAGNVTAKYFEFRKAIIKHLPKDKNIPNVPDQRATVAIPHINLPQSVSLFDILPSPRSNSVPLAFEDIDQDYGFVLYRTTLKNVKSGLLKINGLRDYGIIFINGKRTGILDRRLKQDSLPIEIPEGKVILDILVENLGRINYGPYLLDNKKGITGNVMLNGNVLKDWQMFSLPFSSVNNIVAKEGNTIPGDVPVIRKGTFNMDKTGDTWLDMHQWGKGCVWVNGHNLGRYWEIGPQQTVYIPAEWLKTGRNEIIILELLKPESSSVKGIEVPILNCLKK